MLETSEKQATKFGYEWLASVLSFEHMGLIFFLVAILELIYLSDPGSVGI